MKGFVRRLVLIPRHKVNWGGRVGVPDFLVLGTDTDFLVLGTNTDPVVAVIIIIYFTFTVVI